MIQELPDLAMHVEVMGCPTACQHCWAVGRPYQAMPLEDIAWVLHEVRRFCDAHNLTVDGYPMHEVAAHPQASQIMRLFHDLWNVVENPVPKRTPATGMAGRPAAGREAGRHTGDRVLAAFLVRTAAAAHRILLCPTSASEKLA